jgi:hypothetical protein
MAGTTPPSSENPKSAALRFVAPDPGVATDDPRLKTNRAKQLVEQALRYRQFSCNRGAVSIPFSAANNTIGAYKATCRNDRDPDVSQTPTERSLAD